ncbi:MAG: dTMP kinase [Betaproteobacteria bacterium]|nr:dTMP kinase [Betaproteobacteria bacterium]
MNRPTTSGRFITFEGIDGAGKSTQIAALVEALRGRGLNVLCTREPGGTEPGEKLREVLLGMEMHVDTEAMLMFAARREHLAAVIEPALAAGNWVVCDRFTDATYAYQVGGRGLDAARCDALEAWVHPHIRPDLTLLFDLPPALAAARIEANGTNPDRFEQERRGFFERVRAAYLERARREPGRFHVIDAAREPHEITREIASVLSKRSWL